MDGSSLRWLNCFVLESGWVCTCRVFAPAPAGMDLVEFCRYWSEFVKKPQFKSRLKSLTMKHWSWILVIILLAVTVVTVVLISIFGEARLR